MRGLLLMGLFASMSCDSFLRDNPDYCVDDATCTSETVCNTTLHHCEPGTVGPVSLTAISPSVTALAGGEKLVVTGTSFRKGAVVTFNGVAATSVDVKSATEIDVVVPKVDGSCGPATVVVTNPGGAMASSAALLRWKIGMPGFTPLTGGMFATPTDVSRVQAVDFDNDGKMDVGVLAPGSHKLYVFRGDGQLGFTLLGSGFDTGESVDEFLFAKSDADAFPDVFAWNAVALDFYHNNSGGSMMKVLSTTAAYNAVAVGSVAGSSVADLVGAQNIMKAVDVRLGMPAGAATAYSAVQSSLQVSEVANALLLDKMDSDAMLDIVASQQNGQSALIFYGASAGAFEQPKIVDLGTPPVKIATVDLNHDGKQDLVAIGAVTSAPGISTVLNTGSRSFAVPAVITTTGSPSMLATGNSGYDFNCDDRPDVVVYNTSETSLQIYLNDGNGQLLTQSVPVSLGDVTVSSFTVADIDGDSKPDIALIATAKDGTHSGMILHNTSH